MIEGYYLLLRYWPALLWALGVTLSLAVLVFLSALFISLILIALHQSERAELRLGYYCFARLVKSVPVIVLLVWIYYVLPMLLPLRLSPYLAAYITFSINLSPFLADSLIASLRALSPEQLEVARVMGIGKLVAMRKILLPQAMKNSAPDLASWFITELKLTSVASIIGLSELLHTGNSIISETYQPLAVYSLIGLLYVVLIIGVEQLFYRMVLIEYRRCL